MFSLAQYKAIVTGLNNSNVFGVLDPYCPTSHQKAVNICILISRI